MSMSSAASTGNQKKNSAVTAQAFNVALKLIMNRCKKTVRTINLWADTDQKFRNGMVLWNIMTGPHTSRAEEVTHNFFVEWHGKSTVDTSFGVGKRHFEDNVFLEDVIEKGLRCCLKSYPYDYAFLPAPNTEPIARITIPKLRKTKLVTLQKKSNAVEEWQSVLWSGAAVDFCPAVQTTAACDLDDDGEPAAPASFTKYADIVREKFS